MINMSMIEIFTSLQQALVISPWLDSKEARGIQTGMQTADLPNMDARKPEELQIQTIGSCAWLISQWCEGKI